MSATVSDHIQWAAAGYANAVLPVIPVDAAMSPNSSVPLDQRGKIPGHQGVQGWASFPWRGHEASDADLTRWAASGAGVGLQSRLWPGLDIDILDDKVSGMVADLARKALGPAVHRIGRAPKQLLPYRLAEGATPFGKRRYAFTLGGVDMAVEMLADKQFYVVAGTHPGTRQPYSWPDGEPSAAQLSPITEAQVDAFFDQLEVLLDMLGATPGKRARETAGEHAPVDQAHLAAPSAAVLTEAAAFVPNMGGYDDWIPGLCAFKAASSGIFEDGGRELGRAWTERWNGGGQGAAIDFDHKWSQLTPPFVIGWSWLEAQARAAGWTGAAAMDFAGVVPSVGHNGGPALASSDCSTVVPVGFTEDALAARFSRRFADDMRYVAVWDTWLVWDGTRWARDETLLARDRARQICREQASAAEAKPSRTQLSKASTVNSVERLAQADRLHAAGPDQWDTDPWLLNTPDGVVDLRTGKLGPHDRALHMTKATAVAPAVTAACPTWLLFLDQATKGDDDTIEFVRRWCGYSLTGVTREHALLFVFGNGGNGKSVFLNVAAGVMGDYAMTAAAETFSATKSDRHLTELARLRGARLVTASETEEGRAWAEAKIKQMTGGDAITANFMRQDHFTFTPQFKLTIAGNHKPRLRNVDDAARRRFNLLPFQHRPERPDKELEGKLRAEWPGILRWMIDGCLDWQLSGLPRPPVVQDATEEYFEAEDSIIRWVDERCDREAAHFEPASQLYADFSSWAGRNREPAGSVRGFSDRLESRGFEKCRRNVGAGFKGLKLRPAPDFRHLL
jgi:P4 family phage/plasmid primase-like protien